MRAVALRNPVPSDHPHRPNVLLESHPERNVIRLQLKQNVVIKELNDTEIVELDRLESLAMESLGEVEHQYEVSEDRAVLAPGFKVLDERERRILHLRFFEGLTQSQIAQQVGISQMHVSRLIRRSLEKIRQEIAVDEDVGTTAR